LRYRNKQEASRE